MAFDIVDIQPGGHSGEVSIADAGKAVEVWTLIADRKDYSTEYLRRSGVLPRVYETFHPLNSRLRLMPIEIEQNEDSPDYFKCTLTYSSDPLSPQEDESNPINRRARITVRTELLKETRLRDFYGKPKTNAAGQLFDPPPENNIALRVINIRKNVEVFPDWVFNFADAVNSLPFTIKGRIFEKGCAWLALVELGEEMLDGPFPYCEAHLEMWIRKKRKPLALRETAADVPDAWKTEVLNEGYHELIDGKLQKIKLIGADGVSLENAASPVPLTPSGLKLDPVTIDNANYIVFQDHEELDFNALQYLWTDG